MNTAAERRPLDQIAPAEWDRLAGRSFFGSRAFVALWRHTGGTPVGWTVTSGARLAALLPGVEYGMPPVLRFASLPDGCYGGLLVDPELAGDRVRLAADVLGAVLRHGYTKACVFDFHRTLPAPIGFAEERETARVILLDGIDGRPRDAKLRSQVRRAEREGIRVGRLDWERHHAGFLQLVALSARHHGVNPRHGYAFYEALARLATFDPRVRWYWCERDGCPVSSHVYFVEGDSLFAWQTQFDRRWSGLKPNPCIRQIACAEAARDGIRRLNLGSTPAGANGLASYKARWGGDEVAYPSWYAWQGVGALARSWRGRSVLPRPPIVRVGPPEPARSA